MTNILVDSWARADGVSDVTKAIHNLSRSFMDIQAQPPHVPHRFPTLLDSF